MPERNISRSRGRIDMGRLHEDIGSGIATVAGGIATVAGIVQGSRVTNRNYAGPFTPGADFEIVPTMGASGECPPGSRIARDSCTGEIYCKRIRRRRKRLLSCSDKADIAFITGTLGKGSLAQTAIAALLAKCG